MTEISGRKPRLKNPRVYSGSIKKVSLLRKRAMDALLDSMADPTYEELGAHRRGEPWLPEGKGTETESVLDAPALIPSKDMRPPSSPEDATFFKESDPEFEMSASGMRRVQAGTIMQHLREDPALNIPPPEHRDEGGGCPVCGGGLTRAYKGDGSNDTEMICTRCRFAPRKSALKSCAACDCGDCIEHDGRPEQEMEHHEFFKESEPDVKLEDIGTKMSGFSGGGPFSCMDCVHRTPHSKDAKGEQQDSCKHPKVMADPELGDRKLPDGTIRVGYDDCCNYVRPHEKIPEGPSDEKTAYRTPRYPIDATAYWAFVKQVREEHPDWGVSQVGAEATRRVNQSKEEKTADSETKSYGMDQPLGGSANPTGGGDEIDADEDENQELQMTGGKTGAVPPPPPAPPAYVQKAPAVRRPAPPSGAPNVYLPHVEHPERVREELDKRRMREEEKERHTRLTGVASMKFASNLLKKKALVDIHETPTMLPPRDDMKRHLDEDEQDEAMLGVFDPLAKPRRPARPEQIDPNLHIGAAKIRWKVDPAPVGQYRSFERRRWPSAEYANGDVAMRIECEDDYVPSLAKGGKHAPLIVYAADWNVKPEERGKKGAFVWRKLKSAFPTLADARAAAAKVIDEHPELHPEKPAASPAPTPETPKQADYDEQLDQESEYFLDQAADAKAEAKRHFMEEDYLKQIADEYIPPISMEKLWKIMGEEYTAEFYGYPYTRTPDFTDEETQGWEGQRVSSCPLCKSANTHKVDDDAKGYRSGMVLAECRDCRGYYTTSAH
jgi:hypothetical protein